MNINQTKLVGLTMQLDLLAREFNALKNEFDAKRQTITSVQLLKYKQQLQEKYLKLKKLKEEIKILGSNA